MVTRIGTPGMLKSSRSRLIRKRIEYLMRCPNTQPRVVFSVPAKYTCPNNTGAIPLFEAALPRGDGRVR